MSKGKGRVKDNDKAWRKFVKEVGTASNAYVTVGLHSDAEPYEKGQKEPANVAQVASFHEFGTERMPQRPFFRPTIDGNRDEYGRLVEKGFRLAFIGRLSTRKALAILGMKVQADVRKAITDLQSPPLAESTVEDKKRRAGLTRKRKVKYIKKVMNAEGKPIETGNPLVDSGTMRRSVTYQVHADKLERLAEGGGLS